MTVINPFTDSQITTDDGDATLIQTHAIPEDSTVGFNVDITAFEVATGDSAHIFQSITFKNDSGAVEQTALPVNLLRDRDDPDWINSYVISGTDVLFKVKGEIGKEIIWKMRVWKTPPDSDDPSLGNRISGTDLKHIFETNLTATELEYFIIPANLLITSVLSSSSLSDTHLEQLELYLSGHFASAWSQRIESQKFGNSQVKFQSAQINTPLASTDYGQRVMMLDTTGLLARQLGKPGINVKVMGINVGVSR